MNKAMLLANMDSGKSLRQLMAREGVSRDEMATALECDKATVSALRKSKNISGDKLVKVCGFFEISASDYFKLGEE